MTKKLILILPLLVLSLFAFTFTTNSGNNPNTEAAATSEIENDYSTLFLSHAQELYDQMNLSAKGLSFDVFQKGLNGFFAMKNSGQVKKNIITIVDFTQSSTKERFYTIDLDNKKILFQSVVSHGRNSGNEFATNFSNTHSSYQSSLGFYVAQETYLGKHGKSLRLDGLEKGFNDNARSRAVVMHGADYAHPSVAKNHGRLGRSLGCPALPVEISSKVIETIKNGTCLFIYANQSNYIAQSAFLKSDKAIAQFKKELYNNLALAD